MALKKKTEILFGTDTPAASSLGLSSAYHFTSEANGEFDSLYSSLPYHQSVANSFATRDTTSNSTWTTLDPTINSETGLNNSKLLYPSDINVIREGVTPSKNDFGSRTIRISPGVSFIDLYGDYVRNVSQPKPVTNSAPTLYTWAGVSDRSLDNDQRKMLLHEESVGIDRAQSSTHTRPYAVKRDNSTGLMCSLGLNQRENQDALEKCGLAPFATLPSQMLNEENGTRNVDARSFNSRSRIWNSAAYNNAHESSTLGEKDISTGLVCSDTLQQLPRNEAIRKYCLPSTVTSFPQKGYEENGPRKYNAWSPDLGPSIWNTPDPIVPRRVPSEGMEQTNYFCGVDISRNQHLLQSDSVATSTLWPDYQEHIGDSEKMSSTIMNNGYAASSFHPTFIKSGGNKRSGVNVSSSWAQKAFETNNGHMKLNDSNQQAYVDRHTLQSSSSPDAFVNGSSTGQGSERLLKSYQRIFAPSQHTSMHLRSEVFSPSRWAGGPFFCKFCKKNGEPITVFTDHYLHDPETKKVTCPILREYECPLCGATGDIAHTITHCPRNNYIDNSRPGRNGHEHQKTSWLSNGKLRRICKGKF